MSGDKQAVGLPAMGQTEQVSRETQPTYSVELTLGKRFYNKVLNKYLFAPLRGEQVEPVLVSDTNKITFDVKDTWYLRDLPNYEGVESVQIKKIKHEVN